MDNQDPEKVLRFLDISASASVQEAINWRVIAFLRIYIGGDASNVAGY